MSCTITSPDGIVRSHCYGPRWLSLAALDPFQRAITRFHRLSWIAWTLSRVGVASSCNTPSKDQP